MVRLGKASTLISKNLETRPKTWFLWFISQPNSLTRWSTNFKQSTRRSPRSIRRTQGLHLAILHRGTMTKRPTKRRRNLSGGWWATGSLAKMRKATTSQAAWVSRNAWTLSIWIHGLLGVRFSMQLSAKCSLSSFWKRRLHRRLKTSAVKLICQGWIPLTSKCQRQPLIESLPTLYNKVSRPLERKPIKTSLVSALAIPPGRCRPMHQPLWTGHFLRLPRTRKKLSVSFRPRSRSMEESRLNSLA